MNQELTVKGRREKVVIGEIILDRTLNIGHEDEEEYVSSGEGISGEETQKRIVIKCIGANNNFPKTKTKLTVFARGKEIINFCRKHCSGFQNCPRINSLEKLSNK